MVLRNNYFLYLLWTNSTLFDVREVNSNHKRIRYVIEICVTNNIIFPYSET